jgi:hypothetical protein
MAQQSEISLRPVIDALQKVRDDVKRQYPGWDKDPKTKQAVERLELLEKVFFNECLQSETYPNF